jgi:hypothetical protein
MGKVFRFHPGGNLSHWQNSAPLNNMAINAIEDPNGLTSKKEITSIPSPFARIDLVRTAFKHIVDSKNLDGNTIFHKMVSDSLDVAQIFFNYEKYATKIKIIKWDKNEDLNKLLNSTNPAHKTLGETIRLFLEQDAEVYNFDNLQRIYLLDYIDGPNSLNIIGGTSPATLFFSSANKLEYVNLQEGSDRLFDDQYCPLYKRDSEFIKFIFGLSRTFVGFASKFSYLHEYLELTYRNLDLSLKQEIDSNCTNWYNNLATLNIDGIGNLEINSYSLKTKKNNPEDITSKSGFVIATTKEINNLIPLVLPNDTFNEPIIYTSAIWDYNNKSPFWTEEKLENRILPYDGAKYPFLTISDFLEPVILRTLLPINKEFFFDGNSDAPKGYLLPIKPVFFDYFSLEDLKKKMSDGLPLFELKSRNNNSIEAILRIPIKNNKYITFKRLYNNPVNNHIIPESDEKNNIGVIMENVFTVALYPFLKYPSNVKADYRVAVYEGDYLPITEQNQYELSFYDDENKLIEDLPISQKRFKNEIDYSNKTYILSKNFNYIRVSNNFGNGIIYPLFQTYTGTEEFSFAIDFGTTNTHIEYSINNGEPKPFDISVSDIQLAKLNDLDNKIEMDRVNSQYLRAINNYLNEDFIAKQIGNNNEFSFPIRTSALFHSRLDFQRSIHSFGDISIPLTYEKRAFRKEYKFKTNLKWAQNNDEINKKILKAYFEKILMLIKSKVILNNGDVENIKICWFYPSSMSVYKFNLLEKLWQDSVKFIFNNNLEIKPICESLAPFYYYMKLKGRPAITKPVVSIDLGGGTTDVVIYENNVATLLTSFRFAGNSIFGDEYNRNYSINGFVQKYFEKYVSILENNDLKETSLAIQQIKGTNNSNDIINSFFSLSNNKSVIDKGLTISFLDDLKEDEDFKIIFLIFYSAIHYHVAKIMSRNGLSQPDYILYSGTASKLIQIIDTSSNKSICSKIVSEIFKFVYKNESSSRIGIELSETPKEITSKGGVCMSDRHIIEPNEIKEIFITDSIKQKSVIYNDINNDVVKESLQDYLTFIDFFFSVNKTLNFQQNFGINPLIIDKVHSFLISNSEIALKTGLSIKEEEIGSNYINESVEETLFFYPLIGSIGDIAYKLYNNSFDDHE